MKINHNMSAYVANSNLLKNEDKLTTSLERLSSGYRINHASDDAAGMAISSKMRVQIAALDQASRNASDGVSVIETAEGALGEVTSMVQRMRELAVQSGNDTYEDSDIQAMQDEIEELQEEIDRISTDTEFNKMAVLDGSLGRRVYSDNKGVSLMEASDEVNAGTYSVTITADATQALLKNSAGDDTSPADGTVSINGVSVSISSTDTAEEIYEKLRTAGEQAGVNVLTIKDTTAVPDYTTYPDTAGYPDTETYELGDALYFVSDDYGSSESIQIECSNEDVANYLFGTTTTSLSGTAGSDAQITLGAQFSKQATVNANGNDVSITDRNGYEIDFMLSSCMASKAGAAVDLNLSVTDIGTMTLQIGANAGQQIEVNIPNMSSSALRIDSIDVTKEGGTEKAITALDKALEKVSSVRSAMGAGENRLNYATSSLSSTNENMNTALSRIEDVDMATEMSTYTQLNVLTQAATSVLAQANDIPEQVLQLLQ